MKNKKYHYDGTVPNPIERGKSVPLTHIYMTALSWLGTGASI